MKFKRLIAVFALLLLCSTALSACNSEKFQIYEGGECYVPQSGILFNYNNITSGGGDYWIENDAIYTNVGVEIIDKDGRRPFIDKTTIMGFPLQVYGDKCYTVYSIGEGREGIRIYTFCEFDLKTMALLRAVTLPTLSGDVFYLKYLVVGNRVFVWTKDYDITIVDLDTNETHFIDGDGIVGVGAHNGSFYYVTSTELAEIFLIRPAGTCEIKVFEVGKESVTGSNIATFNHHFDRGTYLEKVNFTSDSFVFLHKDTNSYNDSIVSYNLKTGKIKKAALGFDVDEAVAFDKYMFISKESVLQDDDEYHTDLYRLHIASGEFEKICEFKAYAIELFATSDKVVYASGDMFLQGLVRCSSDGEKKNVIKYGFPYSFYKNLEEDIEIE